VAKGFRKADDTADLGIDYQTALTRVEKWEVYEDWSDTGFGASRLPQRRKVMIDVGTLVVDIYDVAQKQLIWTGRAKKTVDLDAKPDERQHNLDKAAKNCWLAKITTALIYCLGIIFTHP